MSPMWTSRAPTDHRPGTSVPRPIRRHPINMTTKPTPTGWPKGATRSHSRETRKPNKAGPHATRGLTRQKRVAILASNLDPGGRNIASHLRQLMDCAGELRGIETNVVMLDEEIVRAERFPDRISPKPDLAIFASRHQSESGMPCLTAHFPGNFSEALQGGYPRQLSMASPHDMNEAIRNLSASGRDLGYQITVEATHHGPLTDIPCFFIEIGSTRVEWRNQDAGEVVARSILKTVRNPPAQGRVAVGLGGPHYSGRLTELLLHTEFSLSHVVPKHHIGDLDEEMLRMIFARSLPPGEMAILEWKGMRGDERRSLISCLDRMGVPYMRLRHCLQH